MRSIAEALTPTGKGKLLSAHASLKAGGGGGGGAGSALAEFGHPGYRHLAWLGGKAGRVALAEFKASGEEVVLKLHADPEAARLEAGLLRLLAKSPAAGFVVRLRDWHPATEGDPRACIELEVGPWRRGGGLYCISLFKSPRRPRRRRFHRRRHPRIHRRPPRPTLYS